MANIRRRSNSFQITVSLGYDSEMKKISERTTFKPDLYTEKGNKKSDRTLLKEAENFAREFEREILEGGRLTGDKITFRAYYNDWKEKYAKNNLEATTIEGYDLQINGKVMKEIGHLKMSNIYPLTIQNLYDKLQQNGISATTISKIHNILSGLFKIARKWRIIKHNPCEDVFKPKTEYKAENVNCWTLEQAQTFLELIKTPLPIKYKDRQRKSNTGAFYDVKGYTEYRRLDLQYIVMFEILIFCGLRRGELIALEWKDFSYKDKSLSINKSTAFVNNKMIDKSTKGHRVRQAPLPQFLADDLLHLKQQQKEYMPSLGDKWRGPRNDTQKIFIQYNGEQMYLSTPYNKFKSIIRMCNTAIQDDSKKLPEITLHGLRHTNATLLISENTDVRTVSSLLGHQQTSTTMNIYAHSLHKKEKEAVDGLAKILNSKTVVVK